jgi:outer membrane lipoprotein-sorting protein
MLRHFKTLSTARLSLMLTALAALVILAAAAGIALAASDGQAPPPAPLAVALHDALQAPAPAGVSGQVTFINALLPSGGSLLGTPSSTLLSGASGRFWISADGQGRIELQQSNALGDAQLVWDKDKLTLYDASSNTVYRFTAPPQQEPAAQPGSSMLPTVTEISSFLSSLAGHLDISAAQPTVQGGQPAYSVRLAPKAHSGLLASVELAFDATHGVPLSFDVYAKGQSAPVLGLELSDLSFAPVATSDVAITAPAGAKQVDLNKLFGRLSDPSSATKSKPVVGLAQVEAAASFPVLAPDTLAGQARNEVRLAGSTVLVSYGEGLDTVVLVESPVKADSSSANPLAALPTFSANGVRGQELATALGTVLQWQSAGVRYLLAGSLAASAAEADAGSLK